MSSSFDDSPIQQSPSLGNRFGRMGRRTRLAATGLVAATALAVAGCGKSDDGSGAVPAGAGSDYTPYGDESSSASPSASETEAPSPKVTVTETARETVRATETTTATATPQPSRSSSSPSVMIAEAPSDDRAREICNRKGLPIDQAYGVRVKYRADRVGGPTDIEGAVCLTDPIKGEPEGFSAYAIPDIGASDEVLRRGDVSLQSKDGARFSAGMPARVGEEADIHADGSAMYFSQGVRATPRTSHHPVMETGFYGPDKGADPVAWSAEPIRATVRDTSRGRELVDFQIG